MIDLEHFPTSPAANRMLDSISPIYSQSYIMKWLMQVEGIELDEAWSIFQELRLQMFPQTVTWGIEYWEQKFYIVPDDSLALQERRERLMRKYRQRPPINPRMLEKLLMDWADNQIEVKITERVDFYTFRMNIDVPLDYRLDAVGFLEYLDKVNQIHLAYSVTARREMDGDLYLAPVVTQYRALRLNPGDTFGSPRRLIKTGIPMVVGVTQYRELRL